MIPIDIPLMEFAVLDSLIEKKQFSLDKFIFNNPQSSYKTLYVNESKNTFTYKSAKHPKIIGNLPYTSKQISSLLDACSKIVSKTERLNKCASAIKGKLVSDGYITTQVLIDEKNNSESLEIIEGKIYEIIVEGENNKLNKKVVENLKSLRFSHLNINSVENKLRLIKSFDQIKTIRGKIIKLGGNITKSILKVTVLPKQEKWKGVFSISNDGTSGSGQLRSNLNINKKNFLLDHDSLDIGNVLNFAGSSFGYSSYFISYLYPLSDNIDLIKSISTSKTKLIELPKPMNEFETINENYIFSLKINLKDSFTEKSSLYLTANKNSSTNYLQNNELPIYLDEIIRKPSSTYLTLSWDRINQGKVFSSYSKLYFSQALKASIPNNQLKELESNGVYPDKANAIGGSISYSRPLNNRISTSISLNGQYAFNPLLQTMRFGLGSDQGLFGTPSQIITGDSGWNALLSLPIKTLKTKKSSFFIKPFLSFGGVTNLSKESQNTDHIGSTGLILSLKNKNFSNEIGITNTFWKENNKDGIWDKWDLGKGLYWRATFFF